MVFNDDGDDVHDRFHNSCLIDQHASLSATCNIYSKNGIVFFSPIE